MRPTSERVEEDRTKDAVQRPYKRFSKLGTVLTLYISLLYLIRSSHPPYE